MFLSHIIGGAQALKASNTICPLWFGILLNQCTFISCSMASQFNLLGSFQQVLISWMLRSLYEFVDCIWLFGTWSFTWLHFGHGLINWRASLINKINGSRFHLSRFNMWIFILMRRRFGITKTNLIVGNVDVRCFTCDGRKLNQEFSNLMRVDVS
jgi:hypothetical protein